MNDEKKNLLSNLVLISREDSAIGRIRAERRKAEADVSELAARLKKTQAEAQSARHVWEERRKRYASDEIRIRDEREKLVLRRKALSSLKDYKLQQAAVKEIENSSRELDQHEEALISVLVEIDRLEEVFRKAAAATEELQQSFEEQSRDLRETLKALEGRERQHLEAKARLLPLVDKASLSLYQRVVEKYPVDAVVPFRKDTCGGCFMQIGPQVMVQIGRDNSIVRCRGCGRILFLEEQKNREESGG